MKVTPRVTEVKALDEQRLYLKFADGKEKIYDMKDLINNNKFYNNLRDKEYFNRVKPRGVTVEWQTEKMFALKIYIMKVQHMQIKNNILENPKCYFY